MRLEGSISRPSTVSVKLFVHPNVLLRYWLLTRASKTCQQLSRERVSARNGPMAPLTDACVCVSVRLGPTSVELLITFDGLVFSPSLRGTEFHPHLPHTYAMNTRKISSRMTHDLRIDITILCRSDIASGSVVVYVISSSSAGEVPLTMTSS